MGQVEDNLTAQGCPSDVIESGGTWTAPNGNQYTYFPETDDSGAMLIGQDAATGGLYVAVNEGDSLPPGSVSGTEVANSCGNTGYVTYIVNGSSTPPPTPPAQTRKVRYQSYDMGGLVIIPYEFESEHYDMDAIVLAYPLKPYKMKLSMVANPIIDYQMEGISELDVDVTYDMQAYLQARVPKSYFMKGYAKGIIATTYIAGGLIIKDIIPDLEKKWPQAFDLYFPFVLGEPYNSSTED